MAILASSDAATNGRLSDAGDVSDDDVDASAASTEAAAIAAAAAAALSFCCTTCGQITFGTMSVRGMDRTETWTEADLPAAAGGNTCSSGRLANLLAKVSPGMVIL